MTIPVNTSKYQDDDDSDFSDFESIPPMLHFKEHKWRQFKTEYTFTQHSPDFKEYIKLNNNCNDGVYTYSCGLLYPTSRSGASQYLRFNKTNLLFFGCNNEYVATFSQEWKADYKASFAQNKQGFLKNLKIIEILHDRKSKVRTEYFHRLISLFDEISHKTSSHLEAAEDIFQLNLLLAARDYLKSLEVFLQNVERNHYTPQVKDSCRQLAAIESEIQERNNGCLKFANNEEWHNQFYQSLHKICTTAKAQHVKSLEKACSSIWVFQLISKLVKDCDTQILAVSTADISLFSDLAGKNMRGTSIQKIMLDYEIQGFVRKVRQIRTPSLSKCSPLTDQIYLFLFKSLLDLLSEIALKTEIALVEDLFVEPGSPQKWNLIQSIPWKKPVTLQHCIESQARFLCKLLQHFSPTNYSASAEYPHQFVNSIPVPLGVGDSRIIWLYLLDDALQQIQTFRGNTKFPNSKKITAFQSLVDNLWRGYVQFVTLSPEINHESCRLGAHTVARFAACARDFIVTKDPKFQSGSTCEKILFKQADSFANIFDTSTQLLTMSEFKSLIDEYDSFWGTVLSFLLQFQKKFPHGRFETILGHISDKILTFVENTQSFQGFAKEMLNFYKALNEFLTELSGIDYSLLVKEHNNVAHEIIGDRNSYKVLNCLKYTQVVPNTRHFIIEVVQSLVNTLSTVGVSLVWRNDKKLSALGALLRTMTHSFIYLKDQADCEDFNNFLYESTKPFENVSVNVGQSSYEEFITRVERLTESLWYMRKQNEIGVERALTMFGATDSDNIDLSTLKSCYDTYLEKLNAYLLDHAGRSREDKIAKIARDVLVKRADRVKGRFTRETTLSVLAGLSAVWALQVSQDSTSFLKPHCIQIICILRLLGLDNDGKMDNHLAQVLTGQGKSLVLALLTSTLVISGYKVRVVCYSKYLAERDHQDFGNFYSTFNLSDDISYGTFAELAEQVISPVVNGEKKTLRDLVKDRILSGRKKGVGKLTGDLQNTVLLIDEVDVFFSNHFYGNTYNPGVSIEFIALQTIQPFVWKLAKDLVPQEGSLDRVAAFILERVRDQEEGFLEFHDFISSNVEYPLLKRHTSEAYQCSNASLWQEHLELMIRNANRVFKEGKDGGTTKRYRLKDDGKIYYLRNDGIECEHTYVEYLNMFHYFALKEADFHHMDSHNFGYLQIHCGSVSYAYLPRGYHRILGVSGTISSLAEYEKSAVKECFQVEKKSIMPSFFGRSNLIFSEIQNFSVTLTRENWFTEIFNKIETLVKLNRAVLVFFNTDEEIAAFQKSYSNKISNLKVLTENTSGAEKKCIIEDAGYRGTVTLATREMGRGVDFKSSSTVEKNGGMHVIQTFFSADVKEETQIKGRTARKDNKGSYELCLCEVDLRKDGFLDDNSASNYDAFSSKRREKMTQVGEELGKSITQSAAKHDATMTLFERL